MTTNNELTTIIDAIPAFNDNYIWFIQRGQYAVVVDPGQAQPVLEALVQRGVALAGILVTHHHHDHVGGIEALLAEYKVPVYGPAQESKPIPCMTHLLKQGDIVSFDALEVQLEVLDIPGHTLGHIAFTGQVEGQPVVFCGDTLFATGSGRIFEGNSRMMLQSLDKLAKLEENTQVYCAHEYTLSNIAWALRVEPHNRDLQAWSIKAQELRQQGLATLPTTIGHELRTNPFMRVREATVVAAAQAYVGQALTEAHEVLAALREWKNQG